MRMDKKELFYYLLEANTTMPVIQIVLSLVICMLLSLFIYAMYKKTYSGVMYSKNFNLSIMLISIITCMIMMIISSNLAISLGMVGALSIIRFRSAIKDPKDIGYLFWAIGIGLATGTGVYMIGIIGSIFIALLLVIMERGIYNETCYLLVIRGIEFDAVKIEDTLKQLTKKSHLKMKTMTKVGLELTYEIRIKTNHHDLLEQLRKLSGIESLNLVSYNGEIAG